MPVSASAASISSSRGLQRQRQQAAHVERHVGHVRKALRHIADAQRLRPDDLAGGERLEPQQAAHEGGLARTVGADHRDDLVGAHVEVHTVEDGAATDDEGRVTRAENGVGDLQHHAPFPQAAQRPVSSTTLRWTVKPCAAGGGLQRFEDLRRIEFGHRGRTVLADQQRGRLAVMRVGAGDEGVAALDLVDEAMRLEEVQRPVDGDGCRPGALARHALDDVVGTHGRMALGHAVQHVAALAGEAGAAPLAGALRPGQEFGRAMGVVVVGRREAHPVII